MGVGGGGTTVFPDWIYWHLGNCFTCYFSVSHDKRPCYKRCRMQSLDHVEVKIFLCEDFTSVLTVPLQHGTSKLSTRRKVESDAHQCTHLIFQVTAHRNSKFRFLSDVSSIHNCSHPASPLSWDRAPDINTVINVISLHQCLISWTCIGNSLYNNPLYPLTHSPAPLRRCTEELREGDGCGKGKKWQGTKPGMKSNWKDAVCTH